MHATRTIAAAAIAAAAVLAPAAQAEATPGCDGTAAFEHVGYQLNDSPETGTLAAFTGRIHPGDRITITSRTRPGCVTEPHTIVFYGVREGRFDPTEVQHIITATPVDGSPILVPSSDHAGQCQIQIDDVTGPIHTQIDGTHRYNETAIGGTSNRLVREAGYTTDAECAPLIPATSAPRQVTTTAPPTVNVPATEAPTTTAPAPVPPMGPVPSTPQAVVGGDPTPLQRTLPATGVNSLQLLWVGAALIAVGGFTIGAARCRRHNTNQENNQ